MALGLALLGCLLLMCGETVMWSFMERLGNAGGHDPGAAGRLLALTLVAAIAGSLTAAGVGDRLGSLLPLGSAHACFLVALAMLSMADLYAAYAAGACLVMFSVGLGLPVAVTTVADLDRDGRHVVLTVPAIGSGMLIAPGLAGWLASGDSYGPVLCFGALSLTGSLAAFLLSAVRKRRPGGVVPSP